MNAPLQTQMQLKSRFINNYLESDFDAYAIKNITLTLNLLKYEALLQSQKNEIAMMCIEAKPQIKHVSYNEITKKVIDSIINNDFIYYGPITMDKIMNYLRYEGFALPYNGYSVQELIYANWIKIIE